METAKTFVMRCFSCEQTVVKDYDEAAKAWVDVVSWVAKLRVRDGGRMRSLRVVTDDAAFFQKGVDYGITALPLDTGVPVAGEKSAAVAWVAPPSVAEATG